MKENRLSGKVKWGYGIGAIGESGPLNLFYIYFIFFLTNAAGVDASVAGTISMIGAFWSAVTDIYAGYKSDNSRNPKGRRRPFIYKWGVPYAVFTVLLFTDFGGLSGVGEAAYYLVFCLLFFVGLSMVDIPYLSLVPDLTADYDERNSIRAVSNIFNYIGMILASSGTLIFVAFFAGDGDVANADGWTKTALLYGVLALVAYLIAAQVTKGHEQLITGEQEQAKFKIGEFLQVLKLKPLQYVLLYMVFGYGGIMVFTSGYIYYLLYNCGFTEGQASLVLLFYCIVNILLSMFFVRIGEKFEKKTVLIIGTAVFGIGTIIAHFTGTNVVGVYIVFALFAVAAAVFFIEAFSMTYDICDLDGFISGGGREGIIISTFYASGKVVAGVAMFVVGWVLTLSKYDPLALVQTDGTLQGLSLGLLLIPGILTLIAAVVMLKYPITKEKFKAMNEAARNKAEGKAYSEDVFDGML